MPILRISAYLCVIKLCVYVLLNYYGRYKNKLLWLLQNKKTYIELHPKNYV